MGQPLVRSAGPRDVSIIQELAERTWWPAYREILAEEQIRYMLSVLYSPEALLEQMESGHRFLLLSGEGNNMGFASWSVIPGTAISRLHKIYVLPETQRKGAGRFLLNAVEDQAREHDCRFLELNVNRFNKARWFYEKLGFSVERTEDIPIGPFFMNDYVMKKAL